MIHRLIHAITSHMPACVHAKLTDWYARHGLPALMHTCGAKNALAEVLFGKYTGRRAHARRMARLRQLRQKDNITVAFQVWDLGMWKSDSLYRLMEQHPRFTPTIWVLDVPGLDAEQTAAKREKLLAYCRQKGYQISTCPSWEELDAQVAPDLVFIADPYMHHINMLPCALEHLLCYVPYGCQNNIASMGVDCFLHNVAVLNFRDNELVVQLAKPLMRNHGCNLKATGLPMIDLFLHSSDSPSPAWKSLSPPRKKIIYAPHWTIGGSNSFFTVSTFLKTGEIVLQLAQQYANDVQFAFKPHPWLYRQLCKTPGWGKEKADAYYAAWQQGECSQLETGEYRDLFMQSDAMIHDCGSFIIEYMMANKPCMYLKDKQGYQQYNCIAKEALQCYAQGIEKDEIERFIQSVISTQTDEYQARREAFRNTYLLPPNGVSAAQNIINCILES